LPGVKPARPQRTAAMRTVVVQREELAADIEDSDAPAIEQHGLALAGL